MDFIKRPLYLSTVNPRKKNNIKTYYFLGDIPKDVLLAAQNGKTNNKEWNTSDTKILRNFYGTNWKMLLSGDESPPDNSYTSMNFYNMIVGGDEEDLFDTYISDNLHTSDLQLTSNSKILYSNLSVFPEDTLYDLRFKIQLLTKIPIARQFIFYYLDQQGPYYLYQIYINKILYKIQWNKIVQETDITINGVGIDLYFEQHKNDISILSYDKLVLLESKNKYRINKLYVIDLFDVIDTSPVLDKYQFNLLYHGFIIKYWPQLTIDAFKLLLTDYNKIETNYPNLCYNYSLLYEKQSTEQNVLNKVHRYYNQNNDQMSITDTIIINYPKIIKLNVNIRNLFDLYTLNSNVYLSCITIKKRYNIVKKHASVVNKIIDVIYQKNAISFYIDTSRYIIFTLFNTGKYTIELKWNEEDKITFNNIIDYVKNIINPILEEINALGNHVFPTGGALQMLKNENAVFSTTTLSVYYPFVLSSSDFNKLKSEFKLYESLGYVKIYQVQFSRIFNFIFYRGIVDINYPYDGYNWLYEDVASNGRKIRIIHRADKLQIELNNIKNIDEYNIIKRYIFSLIDDFIKYNKIKKEKKIIEINTKTIKRLHDLDPELYNMDDSVRNYSILCQSNRQPVIYDNSDIKNIKLTKYWNFTYNRPAYYACPGKYPYLNFIINKHPKGYCLPCCKKLNDIPGTHVAEVNNKCLKDKKYTDEYIRYNYILGYGKRLYIGRKTYVPDIVKHIDVDFIIYGVEQYMPTDQQNDTNIGFIYSLMYILGKDCIKELADFIKNFEQYYSLANGKASIFHSSEDIYNQLYENFIYNNNILLTNLNMKLWIDVLIDLVRYKYDIDTVIIENNDEEYNLHIHIDNIYVSKCIFLFTDKENGTNPIINKKEISIFNKSDYKSIFNIKFANTMTLNFIISYARNMNKIINKLYINIKNLCYGISIENYISYIPIIESPVINNIPLSYDIRPEPSITRQELIRIIKDINKYKSNSITLESNVILGDKYIGLKSSDQLIYYHIPESENEYNEIYIQESVYNITYRFTLPYDPRDIDKAILTRNNVTDMTNLGLQKRMETSLYNIFLSEFVSIIKNNKNTDIRNKINNVIKRVDLTDSKSINLMKTSLYDILKDYQIDLMSIQDFIDFSYYNSIDLTDLSDFIENSRFEFDYEILTELQKITDITKLKTKLKTIMSPYIKTSVETSYLTSYFNIFTSCIEDTSQFFCDNNRVIIPQNKIEELYDVLMNDIMNKTKTHIIMASVSGIFDQLDFIKRPFEFIEIFDFNQ